MWIILLFVCVSVIFPNNAQTYSSDATAISYTSNSDTWDSTRPPVTLTVQNGRTDNAGQSTTRNSDQPLFYSDQWKLQLLPIRPYSNRDSNSGAIGNERSQLVPTSIRRPDNNTNNSVPYHYSELEDTNEFLSVSVPYRSFPPFQSQPNFTSDDFISNTDQTYSETLPNENIPTNIGFFQPLDFYRNSQNEPAVVSFSNAPQTNLNPNTENLEANTETKQFFSSAEQKTETFDPVSSRTNEGINKPLSANNRYTNQELSEDINFYRSNPRILPQMVPAYFPSYPFLPLQREGPFQQVVPYLSNNQNFDREAGSTINDQIREIPDKQVSPEKISDQLSETAPSETSTGFIPSQPLPVGGYPFGLYLPPFAPPLPANIPASGFPLNPLPLPQSRQIPRQITVAGALQPLVPLRQLPSVNPDASQPLVPVPNIVSAASQPLVPVPNVVPGASPPLIPVPNIVPGASQPLVPVRQLPDVVPDAPQPLVLPQPDSLVPGEETITDPEVNPGEGVLLENPDNRKTPYEFGFDMNDGQGNDQHRKETSDVSGVVTGSYGYRNANGTYRIVQYVAGPEGFRAYILSNEPGVASSGSADVFVQAERPPPKVIAEGRNEFEPVPIVIPDTNADLLPVVSVPVSK